MEDVILDTLGFLEGVDFSIATTVLAGIFAAFWIVVVVWVWFDTGERFSSIILRILMTLMVLVLNIVGFIFYLVIRPKMTKEEYYWSDLERRYLKFESAGLEDCPECGCEILPNFIYCPNCGSGLRYKCDSCDVYLEPEWSVCPFCGTKQKEGKSVDQMKFKKMPGGKKGRKSGVEVGSDGIVSMMKGTYIKFVERSQAAAAKRSERRKNAKVAKQKAKEEKNKAKAEKIQARAEQKQKEEEMRAAEKAKKAEMKEAMKKRQLEEKQKKQEAKEKEAEEKASKESVKNQMKEDMKTQKQKKSKQKKSKSKNKKTKK